MSKLRLDLEDLQVESFDTSSRNREGSRGTVHGQMRPIDDTFNLICEGTYDYTCDSCDASCVNGTCYASCNGTCAASCNGTCAASCYGTCDYTCNTCDVSCYDSCEYTCGYYVAAAARPICW